MFFKFVFAETIFSKMDQPLSSQGGRQSTLFENPPKLSHLKCEAKHDISYAPIKSIGGNIIIKMGLLSYFQNSVAEESSSGWRRGHTPRGFSTATWCDNDTSNDHIIIFNIHLAVLLLRHSDANLKRGRRHLKLHRKRFATFWKKIPWISMLCVIMLEMWDCYL